MPHQPLYEFGGSGSVLHMAVANGFPPQSYTLLLSPLTERYRVVSLPPRPLWVDPPPPASISSWQSLADDLLAGMRQYDLTNVIGVGHSFGAIATMLAATAEPQRFRGIVLLDPTMLPPMTLRFVAFAQYFRFEHRQPLVRGALNRRARFASREEAFAYWREKPLFSRWLDEALWHYTEGLTRPAVDGHGLELTWSPEWEARYYETLYTGSWRALPKLRGLLPVLVIRGTTSNTFSENSGRALRRALPDATYAEIEGHGHLFPHSAPDATRRIMETWLSKV